MRCARRAGRPSTLSSSSTRPIPLNFSQKQGFSAAPRRARGTGASSRQLVSVFVLARHSRRREAAVELCNPASGEGKSELTANVAKLNAQFRERFRDPLLQAADAPHLERAREEFADLEISIRLAQRLPQARGQRPEASSSSSPTCCTNPQLTMYQTLPDVEPFEATDYGARCASSCPRGSRSAPASH